MNCNYAAHGYIKTLIVEFKFEMQHFNPKVFSII
jgi:hypothetical protein